MRKSKKRKLKPIIKSDIMQTGSFDYFGFEMTDSGEWEKCFYNPPVPEIQAVGIIDIEDISIIISPTKVYIEPQDVLDDLQNHKKTLNELKPVLTFKPKPTNAPKPTEIKETILYLLSCNDRGTKIPIGIIEAYQVHNHKTKRTAKC